MNIPGARSPTLAASLFLPGTVGNLFREDGLTHGYDLMDELSMQTFAVGGAFTLVGGSAPPSGQIALAVLPLQWLLAAFLDATFFVVVVGVVGAALSVHLALKTADGSGIGS